METRNFINQVIIPETKEVYKAPVIEIVEVIVEQGFQNSPNLAAPGTRDTEEYTW